MAMARRFREEQAKLVQLRRAGQRTRYVETMYVLDLAMDKRSAPIATKKDAGHWRKTLDELESLRRAAAEPVPAGR